MRPLIALLLLASPASAAPSCPEIAGRLEALDARLNAIAANQRLDAAAGYASVPISALTFGAGWLIMELATAGLETDPLAAYADYSAWLGAGRALGCPVTMREPASARSAEPVKQQERMDR